MSSTSKAWMVAASIGAVEALKDQLSISQAKTLAPSSAAVASSSKLKQEAQTSEESLRKVMYLSCWGPYS
ncbi:unnamed protein product [Linum tenue]|uniref:Uncharacterized protein n=1 Tax=Linum tenue TaxID=586396 RepID=A0AAV0NQM1_9ROSI|nr:unnamed protein product [Linum tenue]